MSFKWIRTLIYYYISSSFILFFFSLSLSNYSCKNGILHTTHTKCAPFYWKKIGTFPHSSIPTMTKGGLWLWRGQGITVHNFPLASQVFLSGIIMSHTIYALNSQHSRVCQPTCVSIKSPTSSDTKVYAQLHASKTIFFF